MCSSKCLELTLHDLCSCVHVCMAYIYVVYTVLQKLSGKQDYNPDKLKRSSTIGIASTNRLNHVYPKANSWKPRWISALVHITPRCPGPRVHGCTYACYCVMEVITRLAHWNTTIISPLPIYVFLSCLNNLSPFILGKAKGLSSVQFPKFRSWSI